MLSLVLLILCFDKGEAGEESRILQRQQWFRQHRGLDLTHRADQKRQQAALRLRTASKQSRASARWQPLGPVSARMFNWRMGLVSGRIAALALHPEDDDILYLGGGSGGLWKTTDGGDNWTPLFEDVGTLSISAIWIDPDDPETVWVGTGDHTQGCLGYFGMGLYRSEDGGQTFTARNGSPGHSLDLSYISALTRTSQGVLLAGGHAYCDDGVTRDGGLYRSTDDGDTWDLVLNGAVGDLIVRADDPMVIFAAVGRFSSAENGIYRSEDAGVTWDRLENGVEFGVGTGRIRIAAAPSNPDFIYAVVNHLNNEAAVYRTLDGGDSWSFRFDDVCEGQCWYNLSIAVNPKDPAEVIVGSVRPFISLDGGLSFNPLVDSWGDTQAVHQDVHAILYHPENPDRFWLGTDGGIWRTDNGGNGFANLNDTLVLTQFYDIAVRPNQPERLFAGSMDNSSMTTNGTAMWRATVNHGDGTTNLVHPLEPDKVYQIGVPDQVAGVAAARSTNGGFPGSFIFLDMTGIDTNDLLHFKMPIAAGLNPAGDTAHLLFATDRVYRSDDDGDTWLPLSGPGLSSQGIVSLFPFIHEGKSALYAGALEGRIFFCPDVLAPAPVWREVTGNYPNRGVTDIIVVPETPPKVWISRGGFGESRLYHAGVDSDQWTPVDGGLPNVPANSVAADPLDPQRIFVGTDIGVYESLNGGGLFEPLMNGMPKGLVVTDLEVMESPHLLVAGTYGRGAWQLSLEPVILNVDAGLDREICFGETVDLGAGTANGTAPLSWSWSIIGGPSLDATQFQTTDTAATLFEANEAGVFTLQVTLMDDDGDVAQDQIQIRVGDTLGLRGRQQQGWIGASDDADLDRNGDAVIDIRDMVIQSNDPRCLSAPE